MARISVKAVLQATMRQGLNHLSAKCASEAYMRVLHLLQSVENAPLVNLATQQGLNVQLIAAIRVKAYSPPDQKMWMMNFASSMNRSMG